MANQIVPLTYLPNATGDGLFAIGGVFWLVVPAANVIPLPFVQSKVPFIDGATLAAIRAGTLLEQPFVSQLFASGTSLATVQAALVTAFGAAQTLVANGASPLSGLIATEYTGSAWVTPASGGAAVFDPIPALKSDVYWAAASGLVSGMSSGWSSGYVGSAITAGTAYAVNGTAYSPIGGAGSQVSFASASANDTAAGTGAQQITFVYLDGTTFTSHSEVVTLGGTTPVNSVATNVAYVESVTVTRGTTNAGIITMFKSTGGTGGTCGTIAVDGSNKTQWTHHYVPAGVTCYVLSLLVADTGVMQENYLAHTGNPSATNLPITPIGPTIMCPAGDQREHVFQTALAVVGPDLIQAYARPITTVSSNTALCNFEWIQF